jgi:hypothetical protein
MNYFMSWLNDRKRALEIRAELQEQRENAYANGQARANELDGMKAARIIVDGAGEDAVMFILTVSGRVFWRSLWTPEQWQEIQTPQEEKFFATFPKA